MLFACTDNFAGLPEHSKFATKPVICSSLMIHGRETLARLTSKPRLFDDLNIFQLGGELACEGVRFEFSYNLTL